MRNTILPTQAYQATLNTLGQEKPYIGTFEKTTLLRLIQAIIRESIIPFSTENNDLIFHISKEDKITIKNVKLTLLNRCLDFQYILCQKNGKIFYINSEKIFLDFLYQYLMCKSTNKEMLDRFIAEMNNHINNDLLANQYKNIQQQKIQEKSNGECNSFFQYFQKYARSIDFETYMEQTVFKGHPIHPCSKTKFGFSNEDVISYSPEFQPIVNVLIIAVQKEFAFLSASKKIDSYIDWFSENFDEEYPLWKNKLISDNLDPTNYVPIPVHPWQVNNILRKKFQGYIKSKQIIIFDSVIIKTTPTLSFRTLKPVRDSSLPYIKLPVSIQATSVFRTLSKKSVQISPVISDILEDIFVNENNFENTLKMVPERCGLSLNKVSDDESKNLGVIFRESITKHISDDENAYVIASLCETSSITQLPILIEIMKSAGVNNNNDAKAYFKKYAQMVIKGYLDLYLIYGISLEGHQQNTMAVFKNNEPQYFLARDFDGIDIDKNVFEKLKYKKDLPLLKSIMSENADIPRNNLIHTVYQSHLGEIIILISQYFSCDEQVLWNIVSNLTKDRFSALKSKIQKCRWENEYQAILNENWNCRALLKMRLMETYSRDGLFINMINPLSDKSKMHSIC